MAAVCIDQAIQSRVNTAPFPFTGNETLTVLGNVSSLAGHTYVYTFTNVLTSKIYVVGHSGLQVDQLGYNPAL